MAILVRESRFSTMSTQKLVAGLIRFGDFCPSVDIRLDFPISIPWGREGDANGSHH